MRNALQIKFSLVRINFNRAGWVGYLKGLLLNIVNNAIPSGRFTTGSSQFLNEELTVNALLLGPWTRECGIY